MRAKRQNNSEEAITEKEIVGAACRRAISSSGATCSVMRQHRKVYLKFTKFVRESPVK
jgi:hypothetical protein